MSDGKAVLFSIVNECEDWKVKKFAEVIEGAIVPVTHHVVTISNGHLERLMMLAGIPREPLPTESLIERLKRIASE